MFFLNRNIFLLMQTYEKIQLMRQETELSIENFRALEVPFAITVKRLTPENEYVISIQND